MLRYKDGYFHLSTHLNEIPYARQITWSFDTVQYIKMCIVNIVSDQTINQSLKFFSVKSHPKVSQGLIGIIWGLKNELQAD